MISYYQILAGIFEGFFADVGSLTATLIGTFAVLIGFFLFWFFVRVLPTFRPKQQTKNFFKKLLLLDLKPVVPTYYFVCNMISFVTTVLCVISGIVHIFVMSSITFGIFRVALVLYFIGILFQTFSLYKYNYRKK